MTLKELGVGNTGRVLTVGGEKSLRRRLLDMGLTPRTIITVRKTAPMGDPLELFLRGYSLTLRLDDAERITVEPCESNNKCADCAACQHCKGGLPYGDRISG